MGLYITKKFIETNKIKNIKMGWTTQLLWA